MHKYCLSMECIYL